MEPTKRLFKKDAGSDSVLPIYFGKHQKRQTTPEPTDYNVIDPSEEREITTEKSISKTITDLEIENTVLLRDQTGIPKWGQVAIVIVVCMIVLGICIHWCCRKRRGKGIKRSASKEKVQPDLEELQQNTEKPDEEKSKQSVQNLGKLQYKLEYDFNSNSLAVTVHQAEGLGSLDFGGTFDPYVKVYLMPYEENVFETKVHRETFSPVFSEQFVFKSLPYADAMNKTLVFAIFNSHRLSKHDRIGEVKVPLHQVNLAQAIDEWRELTSVEGEGGHGQINNSQND